MCVCVCLPLSLSLSLCISLSLSVSLFLCRRVYPFVSTLPPSSSHSFTQPCARSLHINANRDRLEREKESALASWEEEEEEEDDEDEYEDPHLRVNETSHGNGHSEQAAPSQQQRCRLEDGGEGLEIAGRDGQPAHGGATAGLRGHHVPGLPLQAQARQQASATEHGSSLERQLFGWYRRDA